MAFKTTEWELSSKVVTSQPIEYGPRYLIIDNATYTETEKVSKYGIQYIEKTYRITVTDLTNKANFSLTYWPEGWNKEYTARVDNERDIGTLNTLGEALAGMNIGIPNPQDIIGGVVLANLKESTPDPQTGKTYARCYKFEPVPGDIAALANIDQYYIGATE